MRDLSLLHLGLCHVSLYLCCQTLHTVQARMVLHKVLGHGNDPPDVSVLGPEYVMVETLKGPARPRHDPLS